MGVEDLIVPAVVSGAVLAAAGLLSWSFYRRFYLAVPPNQALVLYGGRRTSPRSTGVEVSESVSIRSPRILVGGGAFVGPWNRGAGVLALELIDVDVNVRTGTVRAGHAGLGWEARVALEVKIPTDPQALLAAAEHLFGKSSEEIRELVRHVVEGSIPAVVQRLHLGETEFDLEQVATEIQAVVAADLLPSGLSIRSLAVRELRPIRPVEPAGRSRRTLRTDSHPTFELQRVRREPGSRESSCGWRELNEVWESWAPRLFDWPARRPDGRWMRGQCQCLIIH